MYIDSYVYIVYSLMYIFSFCKKREYSEDICLYTLALFMKTMHFCFLSAHRERNSLDKLTWILPRSPTRRRAALLSTLRAFPFQPISMLYRFPILDSISPGPPVAFSHQFIIYRSRTDHASKFNPIDTETSISVFGFARPPRL